MINLKHLHQDIQLWMGDYDVAMRQDAYDALAMMLETYSRRAKAEAEVLALHEKVSELEIKNDKLFWSSARL